MDREVADGNAARETMGSGRNLVEVNLGVGCIVVLTCPVSRTSAHNGVVPLALDATLDVKAQLADDGCRLQLLDNLPNGDRSDGGNLCGLLNVGVCAKNVNLRIGNLYNVAVTTGAEIGISIGDAPALTQAADDFSECNICTNCAPLLSEVVEGAVALLALVAVALGGQPVLFCTERGERLALGIGHCTVLLGECTLHVVVLRTNLAETLARLGILFISHLTMFLFNNFEIMS